MKKIFISAIIFCSLATSNLFSQSTTINPAGDEILVTKFGTNSNTPNMAGRLAGGSSASPAATPTNTDLLSLAARGHTGSFFTGNRALISLSSDELFTSTANGTRITFLTTTNGTTSAVERMRIDNNGNVGIGTNNPGEKLEILSVVDNIAKFTSTISTGYVRFFTNTSNVTGYIGTFNAAANKGFEIGTSAANTTGSLFLSIQAVPKVTVLPTGNVGIGTTAPSKLLHVYNGASGVSAISSSNFMVEDNTSHYIQMASPEVSEEGVLFGKPSSSASGGVIYTGSNDMNLRTGGNNTRVIISSSGNVGIGSTTPTAKLDIDGDVVVKKSSITVATTYNAMSRSGSSSLYLNASGTINLNGIAGGVDGMILYIITGSGATVNIANQSVSAVAADRIATNTGGTLVISGRGGATLIYESSSALWRVIGLAN